MSVIINRRPPKDILDLIMGEIAVHMTEEGVALTSMLITKAEMERLADRLRGIKKPDRIIKAGPGLTSIVITTNYGDVTLTVGP